MNTNLPNTHGAPQRLALFGLIVSLILFSGRLSAQQSSGVVTGQVTNGETLEPLWQANVQVKGTSIATSTDRDGLFRIAGVPEGEQTLVVTYSGLDLQEVSVSVSAGTTVRKDVTLTSPIYELEAYVVTSAREGQAVAVQQQKQAPNVKLVSAIDVYGNPSANPGELIQRLSEVTADIVGSEVRGVYIRGMDPNFSVIQLDGNQLASSRGTEASREVQIEQLGTSNLQAIELIKAPRPEDEANSVAGFVNLISKRAFDAPGRRVNLTIGTMWRDRESSDNPFQDKFNLSPDLINFGYSDIFSVGGGEKNLGVVFSASRRRSATTQDEVGAGMVSTTYSALYFPTGSTEPLTGIWGVGDFFYKAVATSLSLNIDYKLSEGSYAFFKTSYNTNSQYQRFHRWDIQTPRSAAGFTESSTSLFSEAVQSTSSFAQTYSALFDKESEIYSINPGVSLKLFDGSAQLDISGFYSHANIEYPNYTTAIANTKSVASAGLGWSLDFRNDEYKPVFTQTAGSSVYSASTYTPVSCTTVLWSAPSTNWNLKADFKKDLDLVVPVSVKVGVKHTVNEQDQTRGGTVRTSWSGGTGISDYVGAQYSLVQGSYGPFPFMAVPGLGGDRDILASGYMNESDANAYTGLSNSYANAGEFEEDISAAYIQADFRVGHLRVLGGVRFEHTDTEASGYVASSSSDYNYSSSLSREENLARVRAKYSPITTEGAYDNMFPGLHLTYEGPWDSLVRFSYNKSITRPPIKVLIPKATFNETTQTLTIGNPDLEPYTSNNYDVSVEKYFEPVGKITVGVFYKDLSNYYAQFTDTVPDGEDNGFGGEYAGATLVQYRNLGDAKIRGFNVDYSQQLRFLPGFLSGLGVSANYTRLLAEGEFTPAVDGSAYYSTLAGMAPKSGNVGLSYSGYGLQLRLLANYRGEMVQATSANGSATVKNTVYRDSRTFLDFKSVYHVGGNLELFLDIYNLTNEPTSTQNVAGRQLYTLWQGTGYSAGVNYRF